MSIPAFTLRRLEQSSYASYGQLVDADEKLVCLTIERPWADLNRDGISDRGVSCIPAGTYTAFRRKAATTRHGYDLFELEGVPGRTNIQIHIANLPEELEGCIAVGQQFGMVRGKRAVLSSGAAFRDFMGRLVGVDRITLTVVDPPPLPLAA